MSDPATAFFEGLARRGHEPLLERANGKIRLDLADGGDVDHWMVTVDRGNVVVSRENAEADAVIRTDSSTFAGIVGGSVNTMAASLRGVLEVEGDPELVVLFRRMFPDHPDRREATTAAAKGVSS